MNVSKCKSILMIAGLFAFGLAMADPVHLSDGRMQCPIASVVQKSRLSVSDIIQTESGSDWVDANGFPHHDPAKWSVKYQDGFQSAYQWQMSTRQIFAENAAQALGEVSQILSGLKLAHGPYNEMGSIVCEYDSPQGGLSLFARR